MARYSLTLEIPNVDKITGISISFDGFIKGKKGSFPTFSETTNQVAPDGTFVFGASGKGKVLKGEVTFSRDGDPATLTSDGQIYAFEQPEAFKIKMKKNRPTKELTVPLSELTSGLVNPDPSSALLPSHQFNLIAGDSTFLGSL